MISLSRRNLFLYAGAAITLAPLEAMAAGKKTAPPEPNLRLGNVGVPIVSDGTVINYVFVSLHLKFIAGANIVLLKEKEPYFRDRIVHVAHKVDFAEAGRTDRVDENRFIKTITPELSQIAGKGVITSVEVVMQNPKRRQKRRLPAT